MPLLVQILITDKNQFSCGLGQPQIGKWYNIEPADEGTDAQNRCWHSLLSEYWRTGCHSYNARNFQHFRELIKLELGAGVEKFSSVVNEDGTPCPEGRFGYRLKSWSDYTKKERMEAIDRLVAEMFQAGVDSKKFYEILDGMQNNVKVMA